MLRATWAATGMLCLAACAPLVVQPAADPMLDVPLSWSRGPLPASASASSLAGWWRRFDDPVMTSLIDDALQSNTSVEGARATLRQARALRDVAAAGLLPIAGGSASAQRSKAGGNAASNQFGAGLDASWELDVFGGNRSALDAGEATARASNATLADVSVSVAAEVALGYIALRNSQTRLAIARENLSTQQETLQITQWKLQAGLVSALEVEQARAATAQTRAQLPSLLTTIAQQQHAVAVLTGRQAAALSTLLEPAAPVPEPAASLALRMPAETLRQRPDVRAAELQVTAAAARVHQADAARLPSFKLSGSLGLNALTWGALGGAGAVLSSVLAGLSVPLFDGGAGNAQVMAQQGALDVARASYRAAVLSAIKDVEDALVALQGNNERVVDLQRAALSAGNAATMARQRYGSGLVDFQTVLETQRTRLATQDAVATARADVSAGHVRLYKALGGGWESS